jgi:hypothetical protein
VPWTVEQVLALAPDALAARVGRELASPRKWRNTGSTEGALWGECQGSAAEPYRTVVDLSGPAYRCSCPSRRFPCKHALGLFLAFAGDTAVAPRGDPPEWASDWLSARAKAQQATERREAPPANPERAALEQQKRIRRREERIASGIDDLERWLHDLVRAGLVETAQRPRATFHLMAARLVDAQAPGLARLVRELAILPHLSHAWPERMLIAIGRLGLLLEAWRRQDTFDEGLRAEVRSMVGITESRDDVLATPSVQDRWDVVGRRVIDGERLRVQRTWLWGRAAQRWALLLDFAAGSQALESSFVLGTSVEGELCFLKGALRLRALRKSELVQRGAVMRLPAEPVSSMLHGYAAALAANPWLERWPAAVQAVVPRRARDHSSWWLVDADGARLPLAGNDAWALAALSGGHPLDLFGEWDGYSLWPLSAVVDGQCVPLRSALLEAA